MNLPYSSGIPFLEQTGIIPRDHIRGLSPLLAEAVALRGVATATQVDRECGRPIDNSTQITLSRDRVNAIGPKLLTYDGNLKCYQ